MSKFKEAVRRVWASLRGERAAQEDAARLEEELAHHRELLEAQGQAEGLAAKEARRQAAIKLGGGDANVARWRDQRGWPWLDDLRRDLGFAVRSLRRSPGFTTVALLTLALGIGANTAVFSVVSPILFEPLPYPHPERIVEVTRTYRGLQNGNLDGAGALYLAAHERAMSATSLVDIFGGTNLYIGAPDASAVKVSATRVTHGFFDVFGIRPVIGRGFTASDDGPGTTPTAVLSYALWQSAFGGSKNVVGRRFQLDDRSYTVVGVMPAGFAAYEAGLSGPESADLWVDMQPTTASLAPLGPNIEFLGRLRAGISPVQASADLAIERAAYLRVHPLGSGNSVRWGWGVESYRQEVFGAYNLPLLLMLGAVGLVLLLACANVANLFLSRSAVREREMAMRATLGAGPGRLIRQVLTESLFLAFCGAGFGCLLAWWSVPWLERLSPAGYALPVHGRLDLYVLVFTIGVTVLIGVLFGLAPALSMRRLRPNAAMRGGRFRRSRTRNLLIAGEVAMAFVLLAATGLLVGSLLRLYQVDPGFDIRDVLTAQTTMSGRNVATTASTTIYTQRVLDRLRAIPGVAAAASITGLPLTRAMNDIVGVPDATPSCEIKGTGEVQIEWRAISPGYLATLQIPLLRGRGFAASDTFAHEPVAIISQNFARRCWASPHVIGQMLTIGVPGGTQIRRKIVGIAADAHENGVDEPAPLTFYIPQAQVPDSMNKLVNHWFSMGFVIRGKGSALGSATHRSMDVAAVRQAFAAVDPTQPVFHVRSLDSIKGASLGRYRFMSGLLGLFAALALALSAIGIYGVLSNTVAQRRREIGIRMAVGASRGDVLRQVVGEGVRWAALGLGLGLLAALAVTRVLGSFLFEVTPTDPAVLAAAAFVLLLLTAGAAALPAMRAASVDPVTALRAE